MKRTLGIILWISALGLLASGCGKGGAPDAASKPPSIGPSADSAPAGEDVPVAVADSASLFIGEGDTSDVNQERRHASIQDLAADKYVGCDAPEFCAGIAYFNCNEKGGGSGLYYDSASVTLISRCGSFCVHPDDAVQKGMCDSLCPPKTWADCRKRK